MDVLLLRFDAPLMSFGGIMVDQHGVIDRFPGASQLAGLFGNALGYTHTESDALEELQLRLEYACRWDIKPEKLVDYHTVDLGQEKMCKPGWTTRGLPEHRVGGSARTGIHQRYRHYWANGVMTITCELIGAKKPTTAQLANALRTPVRPLFIGRKTCLPAAPLFVSLVDGTNVLTALEKANPVVRPGVQPTHHMEACWPIRLEKDRAGHRVDVYELRDWRNQIHKGKRTRLEGIIEVNT